MAEVDLAQVDAQCRINTRCTWLANRETAGPDGGGRAIIKLTGFVLGSPCPGYSAL